MAERARTVWFVLDSEGRPLAEASVEVRQKGTVNKITETIFAFDDTDPTQLANPFTSAADGRVEFYLTNTKRVDLFVSKAGFTSQTVPVDVTVSSQSSLNSVEEGGIALAARSALNFADGLVATDDAVGNETDVNADFGTATELANVSKAAEAAGTSVKLARADHKHDIDTAAPTAGVDIGDAASEGTATTLARSDHQHAAAAPAAGYPTQIDIGDARVDGTATTPARSDHQHAVPAPAGAPPAPDNTTGAVGAAATPARSDHKHPAGLAQTIDKANAGAVGDDIVKSKLTADTQYRFTQNADGKLEWGPGGSTAPDVVLFRSGSLELETNSHFKHASVKFVRKTVAESVVSSTAVQDDDHLFFAVDINETWIFEFVLRVTAGSATPDFKATIVVPTGAEGWWGEINSWSTASAFQVPETQAFGGTDDWGMSTGTRLIVLQGLARMGATAGNIKLQWAQSTSDAQPTQVRDDSYLTARRVA